MQESKASAWTEEHNAALTQTLMVDFYGNF